MVTKYGFKKNTGIIRQQNNEGFSPTIHTKCDSETTAARRNVSFTVRYDIAN